MAAEGSSAPALRGSERAGTRPTPATRYSEFRPMTPIHSEQITAALPARPGHGARSSQHAPIRLRDAPSRPPPPDASTAPPRHGLFFQERLLP
ncbi:hypothetical protein C8Q79DRAFT_975523 [Trametes meyenii]|nr:hypothetical protein C8Q79DRAFT_975523 [Trametes meyenii]